jgi:hypothetical protein
MFHLELRQFPHNLCRFNLSEQQLAGIVVPWAQEQWIELGERKWSPHQAKLTVLEGPEIPVSQLSMGRGWRNAQRKGEDVTERVLTAARQSGQGAEQAPVDAPPGSQPIAAKDLASGAPRSSVPSAAGTPAQAPVSTGDTQLLADSLGLELLAQLGPEPLPLARAWELAAARHSGRPASESLAMAELAVESLLRSGLILLGARGDGAGGAGVESLAAADLEQRLRTATSWAGGGVAESLWIARS